MKNKKSYFYTILIFVIVLLLIIYIRNVEQFTDTTPIVVNTPIRANNTCSDPGQANLMDRFTYVKPVDGDNDCQTTYGDKYIRYSNHPYTIHNVCLPICENEKGWAIYPADNTYCIRNDNYCKNTIDLSGSIKDSWGKVCSGIYQNHYKLTSTINSISTVSGTFNNQKNVIQNNYNNLSNHLYSYNCLTNSNICFMASNRFPQIANNFNTINSNISNINYYYNDLSNKIRPFNTIYNDFNCDTYQ